MLLSSSNILSYLHRILESGLSSAASTYLILNVYRLPYSNIVEDLLDEFRPLNRTVFFDLDFLAVGNHYARFCSGILDRMVVFSDIQR